MNASPIYPLSQALAAYNQVALLVRSSILIICKLVPLNLLISEPFQLNRKTNDEHIKKK